MQTIKEFNGKFIEMHAQYICFINFCSVTSAFNNIYFYNQTYQRFSLILKRWLIFLAVTTFTKNNNRRYRKLLPVYLFVVRIGTDAASAVVESRSVLRQYCIRYEGAFINAHTLVRFSRAKGMLEMSCSKTYVMFIELQGNGLELWSIHHFCYWSILTDRSDDRGRVTRGSSGAVGVRVDAIRLLSLLLKNNEK